MKAKRHLHLGLIPLLWLAGAVAAWPLFAAEPASAPGDAMTHFFDQSFNNLKEEAEIARTEGKRGLFIMFSDEDCPGCAKMKAMVMNQAAVQDYYHKHFRLLHLDTRGDAPVTDFAGQVARVEWP
jgi:thioredoxin-related protein